MENKNTKPERITVYCKHCGHSAKTNPLRAQLAAKCRLCKKTSVFTKTNRFEERQHRMEMRRKTADALLHRVAKFGEKILSWIKNNILEFTYRIAIVLIAIPLILIHLVFLNIFSGISILIALFIWNDAGKAVQGLTKKEIRSEYGYLDSPSAWLIGSLILPVISLLFWIFRRDDYKEKAKDILNEPEEDFPQDEISQLERLADLKDRGAITHEEFSLKKAQLLSAKK